MRYFVIILLLIETSTGFAQSCFTYDNAGNRVTRGVCVVSLSKEELVVFQNHSNEKQAIDETENNLDDLIIYPNPTALQFGIKNQEFRAGSLLKITDQRGRTILRKTMDEAPTDVSSLSSGIYYLVISDARQKKIAKLIISK